MNGHKELTILQFLLMNVSLQDTKDKNLHEKLYYTELCICSMQTTSHNITLSMCYYTVLHTKDAICVCKGRWRAVTAILKLYNSSPQLTSLTARTSDNTMFN